MTSLARLVAFALLATGCSIAPLDEESAVPTGATTAAASVPEGPTCAGRIAATREQAAEPGAADFERARIALLGRARGEPVWFAREPAATPEASLTEAQRASRAAFERGRPGGRVVGLRSRHRGDPASLRALVLREGYLYTTVPEDAYELVASIKLADLFDDPGIWLLRGSEVRRLERHQKRSEITYRYVDGPAEGRAADLLFADRVSARREDLEPALHRDVARLADDLGFDRARILHATPGAVVAELAFGSTRVNALLDAEGPVLSVSCMDEDAATREAIAAHRAETAPRRRALAKMRAAIDAQVVEGLRFDRPEGEEGPDRDGELRPIWYGAYLQGRSGFEVDGHGYPVFDSEGRPWPPQVCVDFVLDTFERAGGTWYAARGEKPGRVSGPLDWNESGIKNRRGVIAFGDFAETKPELFEVRRYAGPERIPFRDRARYFAFAHEGADIRAGDVVAIQGMKRDDRIHQHAIFVERVDPLTGFPSGLADQMKRPRRRTWEGIMAEAPARSLYYRVRPKDAVFATIASAP